MATLPADLQEAVGAQARYDQLTAVTDQLRREGGDAAALHQARVQIVGEEATGRLEALDAQRAQWQSRLADFQSRRSAILDDPGLSDSQRQAAVAQLTAQSFSPTEWTRAQALLDAPH
jgi:lipase chaperone LimK